MADEKHNVFYEKHVEAIPAPVISAIPTARSRYSPRWGKLLVYLAVFVLLFHSAHRWAIQFEDEIAAKESLWMVKAFGWADKGLKPPLFGKLAEQAFLTVPNPVSAVQASRQYATSPHMAGTPGDFRTAQDFLALLQNELSIPLPPTGPIYSAGSAESRNATLSIPALNGPTAWIDVYYPVMNTALDRSLEILDEDGKTAWSAELEEVADETDFEAGMYADAIPAWHGLSRGGEAKGKLVYAHYGRKQDYDALVASGVDLNGTIVLTRYGGVFRGLKVKGAQEHGAVACLIYSDPRDDGTVTEENGYVPYPNGPARNPTSVQRGSTQFLSIYPGDPTTPGYPAYENSTRTKGTNIPSIPSLPISWANAQVLLNEIKEGGSNRIVSLINHVDDRVIPIWNTMGVIPGHIKDEVVVIGNHRDAWVMGASDPSSGTASIHEVIRGLGALLKQGWTPLRTIVIASWDAEEYGLIGSTEWGEDFADWIERHVVAYLNLDSSVSGSRFYTSASPSFAHFLRTVAEDIPHPTKLGHTLWDATQDKGVLYGEHVDEEVVKIYEEEMQARAADDLGVGVLGSGSDYTVFLQRIGVASTNHGFQSTLSDPVYHYHSVYDSQRWQELYADPGFLRHVAVARYLGLQTLRLADAIVLPLNTTHYAVQLDAYLDHVEQIASTTSLDVNFSPLRESIASLRSASESLDKEKHEAEHHLKHLIHRLVRRRIVRRRLWNVLCKIKKIFGKKCGDKDDEHEHERAHGHRHHHQVLAPPTAQKGGRTIKPRIGRAPAWVREQRAREGRRSCQVQSHEFPGGKIGREIRRAVQRVRVVNKKLVSFERGFIHPDGIKDREWYRHLGVAPGKWLGYGATTLPALTEAITFEANATMAQYEAGRLKSLIDKLAETIGA
ncbi:hypothetical protein AcV5_000651 [Taiwanofungus camphoratus]|nr:hypothetical protein AcV5_000651 [Antrodia cinnamomea]